jgi:hypothetical protein
MNLSFASKENVARVVYIPFLVILSIIIIDTAINRTYLYRPTSETEYSNLMVFALLSVTCIAAQSFALRATISLTRSVKRTKWQIRRLLYLVVLGGNVIFAVVLGLVVLQVWTTSSYDLNGIIIILGVSYSIGITALCILVVRFCYWLLWSRNSVVMLYTISIFAILLNSIVTFVLSSILVISQPVLQYETRGTISIGLASPTIINLNILFGLSSILSFVLMWIATAVLLRQYSRKMSRVKYWFLVSLPLLYFLIQFQPLILQAQYLVDSITLDRLYIQLFTASKAVGGILFAITFWMIGRKVESNNIIRKYMIISGFGIAILFGSNQGIIVAITPYPPFGVFTVSFFGLASYLTLVGIYYSAISVSQDTALRRSIRKSVEERINLIDVIGKAEVQNAIAKNVAKIYNKYSLEKDLGEETGRDLEEDEIKDYISEVMTELKKRESDNPH